MSGLVGTHDQNHVAQTCIRGQFPVIERDPGRRHVGVGAIVDAGQVFRVAEDRFLLQIADDAVRRFRRDQIKQEEEVVEGACTSTIRRRSRRDGLAISMKVIRCMRSFSASSSNARIQP